MLSKISNYIYKALGCSQLHLPIAVQNNAVQRLYDKATRDQWKFSKNEFPIYTKNIDLNEWLGITDKTRLAAARGFSSFYHGEHGAKLISAQLCAMAPTHEASKFLATQTMDEARHMEAFEHILGFIDKIHPMNPFLNAFLGDIARAPYFEDKLVGMNLLVEGLALSAFNMVIKEFKQGTISSQGYQIIGKPIEQIIRDESRHVGFGVVILPEVLSNLGRLRKTSLRVRQLAWLGLLYGSVKYHQEDMELLGLDYLKLLENLIEDHERRVFECGGNALVSTEKMKSVIPIMDKLVDKFRKFNMGSAV